MNNAISTTIRKPSVKKSRKKSTSEVDRNAITAVLADLSQVQAENPRKAGLIALLKSWLMDESGYDETTWPQLRKSLDQERGRIGARRLYDG